MSKEIIWQPSKELIENSKLTKFIQYCNLKNYDELEKKSFSDPGWLWDNVIKFSDLKFYKPYSKILDDSKGIPWTRWCIDCLLYASPSPRDLSTSRMPSSA